MSDPTDRLRAALEDRYRILGDPAAARLRDRQELCDVYLVTNWFDELEERMGGGG